MKFGKEIRERLHHPWAPFYVDYKACKRRIARCLRSRNAAIISDATASSSSEADLLEVADPEAYFFFEFDRQLEKATRFYAAKAAALAARTKALQYRVLHLLPLTKDSPADPTALHDAGKALQTEISLLLEFAQLNAEGLRKIVKKFDKKLGQSNSSGIKTRLAATNLLAAPAELEPLATQVKAHLASLQESVALLSAAPAAGADVPERVELVGILRGDDVEALRRWYGKWQRPVPAPAGEGGEGEGGQDGQDGEGAASGEVEEDRQAMLDEVLDLACVHHAVESARACLAWGSRPTAVDVMCGESAWHTAARRGFTDLMEMMYESMRAAGDEMASVVNLANVDGQTALHHGARYGHEGLVAALIAHGADPNQASNESGSGTALMAAVTGGNVECVRLVLAAGGHAAPSAPGITTPLGMAAHLRRPEVVSLLLAAGAPTGVHDREGQVPLHRAVLSESVECVQLLVAADPAQLEAAELLLRRRPLVMAARTGNERVVDVLLAHGASPLARDGAGWSAYTHAMYRGYKGIVQALVSKCPELEKQSSRPGGSSSGSSSGNSSGNNSGNSSGVEDAQASQAARRSPMGGGVSPKSYGHEFLRLRSRLVVTLKAMVPPRPRLQTPQGAQVRLEDCVLRVRCQNGSPLVPLLHKLPLKDNAETEFDVDAKDEGGALNVHFEISSIFDANVVLARGVVHHREHPTDQPHQRWHTCVLMDASMDPVCDVDFTFLVSTPFSHPKMVIDKTTFWTVQDRTRVWGHRGAGGSKASKVGGGLHRTHVKENTVLSFVTAASLGAEYVEMDVQLTADGVPVIYHNWKIDETDVKVQISAVTAEEFVTVTAKRREDIAGQPRKHAPGGALKRTASAENLSTPAERPSSASPGLPVTYHHVETAMPTLEQVLRETPASLGLNIELKYPQPHEIAGDRLQVPDMNTYCDTVLKVIYDNVGNRSIAFSSFHPDICRHMCLKQPTFPVFFLTEAGGHKRSGTDHRPLSLRSAVRFAKAARLPGIVSHGLPLVRCPEIIRWIKACGLLLLTYGTINNESEAVRIQESNGVDAVIVDHVAHIRKGMVATE